VAPETDEPEKLDKAEKAADKGEKQERPEKAEKTEKIEKAPRKKRAKRDNSEAKSDERNEESPGGEGAAEEDDSLCEDCSQLLHSEEMTALKGMLPQLESINLAAMLTDCNRDVERAANLYFARPAFVQKTYQRTACSHWRK
jgi:hypothetical protein